MDNNYDDDDDFDNDDDDYDDVGLIEEDEKNNEDTVDIVSYEQIKDKSLSNVKKTLPFMTKYEKAKITGLRLTQLENGAMPCVSTVGVKDIREIVNLELKLKKLPLIIVRILPNNVEEYWRIEDFEYIGEDI